MSQPSSFAGTKLKNMLNLMSKWCCQTYQQRVQEIHCNMETKYTQDLQLERRAVCKMVLTKQATLKDPCQYLTFHIQPAFSVKHVNRVIAATGHCCTRPYSFFIRLRSSLESATAHTLSERLGAAQKCELHKSASCSSSLSRSSAKV